MMYILQGFAIHSLKSCVEYKVSNESIIIIKPPNKNDAPNRARSIMKFHAPSRFGFWPCARFSDMRRNDAPI